MPKNLAKLEFHEVAGLFPPMEGAEFDELVEDIRQHGLREPIWLHDGKIVDGRNRYLACLKAQVGLRTQEYRGRDSLVDFVLSMNLTRRHLNESQRALIATKIANLQSGQCQPRGLGASIEAPVTQPEAAARLNVSRPSVQRARKVLEKGGPELVKEVESGGKAVSRAVREIDQAEGRKAQPPAKPTTEDPLQATIKEGAAEFKELISTVRRLRREIKKLSKSPTGTFLHVGWAKLDQDLDRLLGAIKFSAPHATCVYCNGDGCKMCHDGGWLSLAVHNAAPESMKGADP